MASNPVIARLVATQNCDVLMSNAIIERLPVSHGVCVVLTPNLVFFFQSGILLNINFTSLATAINEATRTMDVQMERLKKRYIIWMESRGSCREIGAFQSISKEL